MHVHNTPTNGGNNDVDYGTRRWDSYGKGHSYHSFNFNHIGNYFTRDITRYFTHGRKSLAPANKSIARFDSWKLTDGLTPFSEVTSLSSYIVTLVTSSHLEEDNRVFYTYIDDENVIQKRLFLLMRV